METDHLERILCVRQHVNRLLRLLRNNTGLQTRRIFCEARAGLSDLLLDLDEYPARVLAPRAAAQFRDAARLFQLALEPIMGQAPTRTDRGSGVRGGVEGGGEDCGRLDR
jgi:hypothetical protein